jgi:hypothetical protein
MMELLLQELLLLCTTHLYSREELLFDAEIKSRVISGVYISIEMFELGFLRSNLNPQFIQL